MRRCLIIQKQDDGTVITAHAWLLPRDEFDEEILEDKERFQGVFLAKLEELGGDIVVIDMPPVGDDGTSRANIATWLTP